MKLTIKNFQRLTDTSLEIQKGFNCLVGPSNLGKSSLLRAIFSVLRNDFHPSYITKDQSQTTLTLSLEDSPITSVKFERGKPGTKNPLNQFTVEYSDKTTEVFPKVGTSVPQPILTNLPDYTPLETDRGDVFDLNYQSQFEGMFLFTSPSPAVSSLFNSLFDATKYETALRLMNHDLTLSQSQIASLNADSVKFTDEIHSLTENRFRLRAVYDRVSSQLTSLQALAKRLDSISKAEGMFRTVSESGNIIQSQKRNISRLKVAGAFLTQVLTSLEEYRKMDSHLKAQTSLRNMSASEERKASSLRQYKTTLTSLLQSLARLRQAVTQQGVLSSYHNTLSSQQKDCDTLHKLQTLTSEYKDRIHSTLEVCPFCGQKLSSLNS